MLNRRVLNGIFRRKVGLYYPSSLAYSNSMVTSIEGDEIVKKIKVFNKQRRVSSLEVDELVTTHLSLLRKDRVLLGQLLYALGKKSHPLGMTLLETIREVLTEDGQGPLTDPLAGG